jgi:hypothetical protein
VRWINGAPELKTRKYDQCKSAQTKHGNDANKPKRKDFGEREHTFICAS